jgi:glycerophosphoryl diester phosphodiesterase
MTKDGEIMVCHDGTFDRICEIGNRRNVKVLDTMSDELPKFKDEMPLHFSHG